MIRAILALATVAALTACGQADQAYPSRYEFAFIQACEAQGPADGVCACTWARITAEVPRREFEAFERLSLAERDASPLKAQFEHFARSCAPPPAAAEPTAP